MISKSEIEKRLGIKLEYYSRQSNIEDYEHITNTYLTEKSEKAIINLQLESLRDGDIETAEFCNRILEEKSYVRGNYDKGQLKELRILENEHVEHMITEIEELNENISIEQLEEKINKAKLYQSGCTHIESDLKDRLSKKIETLQTDLIEKYSKELHELDNSELNTDRVSEIMSRTDKIRNLCNLSQDRNKFYEIIQKKIDERVSSLDKELMELNKHIELPENESKIDEIQAQIEGLETVTIRGNIFGQPLSKHKSKRIEEQGIDMSKIMSDIQKTAELKGRISQSNYDRINGEIAKKSEYLEKKLAYLQQYRNIPGNEERIAEIESQIENMQDSWIVASNGFDLQAIIDKNNAELNEKRARLPEAEKELSYTIQHEPSKVGLISRLRFEIERLMKSIDKLENENSSIQDGTNKKYIGEHHKGRLDNDEQLKAEQAEKLKLQKERIEQKQKELIEQEERAKVDREEKLKKENEERAKRIEQDSLREKQTAKAKAEEQARIKAEQDKKAKFEEERQASIDNDIKEYEQYEGLVTRKPEIEELYDQLSYEDFSSQVDGHISKKMDILMKKVKSLPDEEKSILLNRYNKTATYQINEQGVFADEEVRKKAEQETKARAEEQARIKAEQEEKIKAEEQARIKEEQETKARAKEQARINAEQEVKMETQTKEYMSSTVQNISSNTSKTPEQQQPEKIKPQEKSIKDEVGDEFKDTQQQMQETRTPTVDLWMNRFGSWYGAIDRVSQNVKAKFVKMKSDIVKAISTKIKERNNKKEISINQDQNVER